MSKIPFGPTYDEMLHPEKIDPAVRQKALKQLHENELDPINLFNITWKDESNRVRKVVLPPALTGVDANIVVMLGCGFPSGSHKVGPAYSTLIEGLVDGEITSEHTILGPSTGNFGIGTAYISNLLGLKAVVIMPDNMSKERYERIRKYGGELELTPGSAGTLAAGDQIKVAFPEAKVAALEPYECSTLANGGRGQHRIEGIGDKMCTLIHNVLTTDFIILIKDEETVQGLKVFHDGTNVLLKMGVDPDLVKVLAYAVGPSGICNIIGAIKLAKYMRFGPGDNVVTVATDGFDRYDSVLADLDKRYLELSETVLDRWTQDIFIRASEENVYDVRRDDAKARLFRQKESDWLKFGYTQAYLDGMKEQNFWDDEYAKIEPYNAKILAQRGK